jgi:Lysyl oxidase
VIPTRRVVLAALALLLVTSGSIAPPQTAAASDRLPNLRMMHLRDFRLQWSGGRRLLRFTAIMANVGAGPFEVRGSRPNTSTNTMSVIQAIGNTAGGERTISTDAVMQWAGDGHNHWHVKDTMVYQMWPANGGSTRRDEKVGFCFLDSIAINLSMPRAPQAPFYRESWCGTSASLRNRAGISVGWGDHYPANFAFQWIDVTGLPTGTYTVRAKVDPANDFLESSDQNNCTWARINLPSSGTAVSVTATGFECVQPPVRNFPGATEFDPPETLWLAAGTHTGYRFSASGAIQVQKTATIPAATTAVTLRLATVPGRTGEWFYVDSGPWNDYWLQRSSRVMLAP